ncbi:MAG: hypothetical protein M0R66_03060 [Candidatus Omnitrophica bacterium]|nr:hypothetical protein [Candidatus Omnitrophota bacterium]
MPGERILVRDVRFIRRETIADLDNEAHGGGFAKLLIGCGEFIRALGLDIKRRGRSARVDGERGCRGITFARKCADFFGRAGECRCRGRDLWE